MEGIEDYRRRGEVLEEGSGRSLMAVEAEVIGTKGVDGDQHEVGSVGEWPIRPSAARGGRCSNGENERRRVSNQSTSIIDSA